MKIFIKNSAIIDHVVAGANWLDLKSDFISSFRMSEAPNPMYQGSYHDSVPNNNTFYQHFSTFFNQLTDNDNKLISTKVAASWSHDLKYSDNYREFHNW